jgi:hypothetical protein
MLDYWMTMYVIPVSTEPTGWYVALIIIGLLLAGNLFFIRKLLKTLEGLEKIVNKMDKILGQQEIKNQEFEKDISLLWKKYSGLDRKQDDFEKVLTEVKVTQDHCENCPKH